MKINPKYLLLCLLCLIVSSSLFAKKIDRASRMLENDKVAKAIKILSTLKEDTAELAYPLISLLKGDCYFQLDNGDTALIFYKKAFDKVDPPHPKLEKYYLNYIDILLLKGEFQQAHFFMEDLKEDWPINFTFPYSICDRQEKVDWYLTNFDKPSPKVGLDSLSDVVLEDVYIDLPSYGMAVYSDSIVFAAYTSLKNIPTAQDLESNETLRLMEQYKRKNTDLYISSIKERGENKKLFAPELATGQDEGGVIFTSDQKGMYFTRHDWIKGKDNYKIYYAEIEDGKWKDKGMLNFCSDDFSCMHPRLADDDKTLYFVSNNSGGLGGLDIFKVSKYGNSWGLPQNLGEDINTEGDEVFPYLKDDTLLLFSSNGRFGFGGFDIFYVNMKEDIKEVKNLLASVNSFADECGLSSDPFTHGNLMYFTYNRDSVLVENEKSKAYSLCYYSVEQQDSVRQLKRVMRIAAREAAMKSERERLLRSILGDDSVLLAKMRNSNIDSLRLAYGVTDESTLKKMIYFDFNSFQIKDDAKAILSMLGEYLRAIPNIKLDLIGHASLRGSENYNMFLSAKRARETKDILMLYTGLTEDRFVLKACGEYFPQRVELSVDDRAKNRRVEIVTLMESESFGMEVYFKMPYSYTDDIISRLADIYIDQNSDSIKIYKVKEGEGIFRVAKNNNISIQELIDYNNLGKRTELKAGEYLFVKPVPENPKDFVFIVRVKDLIVLPKKQEAIRIAEDFDVDVNRLLEVNQMQGKSEFPAFYKVIVPIE